MIPIALHEKTVQDTFYKIKNDNIKSVAITSAKRYQGVTSFSYALARRASANNLKVLLVDFSFSQNGQADHLALEKKSWHPSSDTETKNIIQLSHTNLSILTAPKNIQDHWAFQDQDKIKKMLDALAKDYDLIIADMPSILDHHKKIQTEILCAAFENIFIVALAGLCDENDMIKIKKTLEQSGISIDGIIINDQFNSSLAEELKREIERAPNFLQSIKNILISKIENSPFLNQTL